MKTNTIGALGVLLVSVGLAGILVGCGLRVSEQTLEPPPPSSVVAHHKLGFYTDAYEFRDSLGRICVALIREPAVDLSCAFPRDYTRDDPER